MTPKPRPITLAIDQTFVIFLNTDEIILVRFTNGRFEIKPVPIHFDTLLRTETIDWSTSRMPTLREFAQLHRVTALLSESSADFIEQRMLSEGVNEQKL